jgi:hypothetical protein
MLDYNVVSQSAFRAYPRLVMDRKLRERQTVMIYGGTNLLDANNIQSVAWSWDAWCRGGDGVLPWQTIGTAQSWTKPDELALFYPRPEQVELVADRLEGRDALSPLPSIRLKAYCYGQQDVELLTELARRTGRDRYDFGRQLIEKLGLKSVVRTTAEYAEDAGWADYGQLAPEDFTRFRREVLRQLDALNK